ncbi:hypothetical protein K503DRAFT_371005 [Rhizopogon vinicolor AM-OR11-026]|uniref:Uncharacterized protein n=1 Tax=Rhizopogon vinicolor AM-OR11-026 TaxID=1314800 RepID=A0A1B7MS28_9AGAM|nr:hypothetical protein K503DRAFT_371005 [Rhizopogon vinicolor AM-OR11-026]
MVVHHHHHIRVDNRHPHPAAHQRPKMRMRHTGRNMATMSIHRSLRSGPRASRHSITKRMPDKQQRPHRVTLFPLHRLSHRWRFYLMLSYVAIVPCFICVISFGAYMSDLSLVSRPPYIQPGAAL